MKKLITTFLICFSFSAYAGKDCHYDKVVAIQAQKGSVLFQLVKDNQSIWKVMGEYNAPYLQSYQSVTQQAMASGEKIVVRYPEGHDCLANNFSTVPDMIRIYK
ncbi:hypothetical protein FLL45_08135 [Aliikangiella marina]|uniref:Uncharacterized protein n=1 Tax=Aliikangiella marina TaxID=1712262 RepID=A0A545TCI2_9GAMM|nr:hypothetical protein [Aliikangiella marina]TQV74919.1 hypothetical protein FLL45_08135 [Aliikangiella marina]